ncbi:MAG: glycosyltransferase [Candidatus Poribacteria bacterium]
MNKFGQIAIITRTKDRSLFLSRAIGSVLSQTYSDWLHVIINDGGDRGSVNELVEQNRVAYQGRVLCLHNEHSKGMEAASNVGIHGSSSKYIVLLDDDDTWDSTFLHECVARLEKKRHPSIKGVIAHSDKIIEEVRGKSIVPIRREPFNSYLTSVSLNEICGGNIFTVNAFVYERSVYDQVGFYREDLPVLGDWEFNIRFVSRYDIDVVPHTLAFFHNRTAMHTDSFGNTVVEGKNDHLFFTTFIQNEYLRKDLEFNRIGIGVMMSLNAGFKGTHIHLHNMERQHILFRVLKAARRKLILS